MASNNVITADTIVGVKVTVDGYHHRFKFPLRDLGANVFLTKLRSLIDVPSSSEVVFERYSDSAAAFVKLDPNNVAVFKQLYRAAKAKLKLRIRATVLSPSVDEAPVAAHESAPVDDPQPAEIHRRHDPVVGSIAVSTTTATALPLSGMAASASVTCMHATDTEDPAITGRVTIPTFKHVGDHVDGLIGVNPTTTTAPTRPAEVTTLRIEPQPLSDAPVPHPFPVRRSFLATMAQSAQAHYLAMTSVSGDGPGSAAGPPCSYMVYCNACDWPISTDHYHCGSCDGGDFDLCSNCVDAGRLCHDDDHWLIKRTVRDGQIVNSVTETVPPRKPTTASATTASVGPSPCIEASSPPSPPSASDTPPTTVDAPPPARVVSLTGSSAPWHSRCCHQCLQNDRENRMVRCSVCDDFALCMACLIGSKHGHHPHHTFESIRGGVIHDPVVRALCAPGRNVRHHAICDGCDKIIVGVRHKCLECPDWDYCSCCVPNASFIHPRHRFVPITEPIPAPSSSSSSEYHLGTMCDGPLCASRPPRPFIRGDRYKCAVCHDTDFCADCEASPANTHNPTHPLIKFKTPVRGATVCTMGERADGRDMPLMGDHHPRPDGGRRTAATTTTTTTTTASPSVAAVATAIGAALMSRPTPSLPTPVKPSTSTATHVQTVVHVKSEVSSPEVEPEMASVKPETASRASKLASSSTNQRRASIDTHVTSLNTETAGVKPEMARPPTEWVGTELKDESAQAYMVAPTADTLSAYLVGETTVDGTVLPPNHVFQQTWTLKNPGPADWPKGCCIRLVGGDNMRNVDTAHPVSVADLDRAIKSDSLPLALGTDVHRSFTVTLKTPKKRGRYISYWLLTTPDRVRFGPKLWCEINVQHDARPDPSIVDSDLARPETGVVAKTTLTPTHVDRPTSWVRGSGSPPQGATDASAADHGLNGGRSSPLAADVDSSLPLRGRYVRACTLNGPRDAQSPERPQVEHIEDVGKARDDSLKVEESTMIFPKLEKESPASSDGGRRAPEVQVDEEQSEGEQVMLDDEESDVEDDFLTDEEYDILDASDEEVLVDGPKAVAP